MPRWQAKARFVGYRVVRRFILFMILPDRNGIKECRFCEMAYIQIKHVWAGTRGSFKYSRIPVRWADDYNDLVREDTREVL